MAMSIMAGAAFIKLTLNDASLNNGLEKAQKNIETFSQRVNAVFNNMAVLGDKAFNGFLAMSFPVGVAIREFSRFDDTLRTLRAISGANSQTMSALETQIRNLGKTTAFTASQVAGGGVALARLGLNADELKSAMPAALDLVRATGTETHRLGEVSEYAAAQLRIFNLDSSKFSDVADVMAYAANKSAMDISDLGEAMKIAGPSANVIGENIRDTASALMLFANAGIKGSLAGTSLRKVYQSLAAVSGQTEGWTPEQLEEGLRGKDQLMEMGIKVVDTNGNLRKASEIMQDLAGAVKRMKSGEKIKFATDVFDLRGSLGALSMLSNPKDLQRFREELNNVGNYAKKTAAEIEKGPGGQLRLLRSALEDLRLTFGGFMATNLMPFIDILRETSLALGTFIKMLGGVGTFITQFTAGATGLGLALWGVTQAIRAVGSGFAPLLAGIKWLDSYASGARKAAAEFEKMSNAQITAIQNQVKLKTAENVLNQKNKKVSALENELQKLQAAGKSTANVSKSLAEAKKAQTEAMTAYGNAVNSATTAENVLTAAKVKATQNDLKRLAVIQSANNGHLRGAALSLRHAKAIWRMNFSTLVAAKNSRLLALALKSTAGATMVVDKAFKFIATNPVLVAFTALSIVIQLITSRIQKMREEFQKTLDKAKEMTEEAERATARNEEKRNVSKDYFERAKQLAEISKTAKLSEKELEEAAFIAKELEPFGSNGWLKLEENTKKLLLAADAAEKFKKSLQGSASSDIENEIKALENQLNKLIYKKVDITRSVTLPQGGVYVEKIGEKQVYRDDMTEDQLKEMNLIYSKIRDARKRLMREQILANKSGFSGITGETKKMIDMKKELSEIEGDVAKKSRSDYENQIHDIQKMREEHKKLLEQLKAEATRLGKNDAAKMYDEKLKSMNKFYDAELKKAEETEKKRIAAEKYRFDKERKEYSNFYSTMAHQNALNDKQRSQDESIDKLVKNNSFNEALTALNDLLVYEKNILFNLSQENKKMVADFYRDAVLTEQERDKLNANQKLGSAVNSRINSLQDKIRQITEQASEFKAKDISKVVGGFNASAVARALYSPAGNEAERTAKATEDSKKILKEIKQMLPEKSDYEQVYSD